MAKNNPTPQGKVHDFVGKSKIFFIISTCLILISILSTFIVGTEIAIEFKGGTMITYTYQGDLEPNDVRADVESVINTPVKIYQGDSLGGDNEGTKTLTVSYSSDTPLSDETREAITAAVVAKYPNNSIGTLPDAIDVSATSGREFFLKCLCALLLAVILLILYIAWRFKRISGWSAGVAAIIALLHDSIIVYGSFVLCGFEIDSNFVAVVLTILGYSINNTIVIYDRIRENRKLMPKAGIVELVNTSVSQSVTRSVRTTVTTIAAMAVICIFAIVYNLSSILSFALPLIIGMIAGAYSSLCLAPSIWVSWQKKKEQ